MARDINQVLEEAAAQIAAEFNETYSNYQLNESDYARRLLEAVSELLRFEAEHTIARSHIQNKIQGVVEELTDWIMNNEVVQDEN